MIDEDEVRRLGTGRWTVPLLALLWERKGARFAELLAALDIARDSLVRTLAHVAECGWVLRNPGYGHPLRPEYILTPQGEAVAAACGRMMAARRRLGLAPDSLPRWALPILGGVAADWTRFSTLRAGLAPITPRALSLNLKQMIEGTLIERRLEPGYPPAALYGLAPPGRDLLQSLRAEG